jgi:hypothetical protein
MTGSTNVGSFTLASVRMKDMKSLPAFRDWQSRPDRAPKAPRGLGMRPRGAFTFSRRQTRSLVKEQLPDRKSACGEQRILPPLPDLSSRKKAQ